MSFFLLCDSVTKDFGIGVKVFTMMVQMTMTITMMMMTMTIDIDNDDDMILMITNPLGSDRNQSERARIRSACTACT